MSLIKHTESTTIILLPDVNECADAATSNPCGLEGVCRNNKGGYTCECGEGYEHREGTCLDIGKNTDYLTECVNSSVATFARKFLWKFPRPVGRTTAAVQPSKKKIARGTYTKTF